jgi:glycine/D-amino acid oxidase-like deaminating enzyme
VNLFGFLGRRRTSPADVTVVGSGMPARVVALELARRRCRVRVLGTAGAVERPAGLGLVAVGPGRPYEHVVHCLGREAARGVWTAGRENLDRVREFLEETRRGCGHEARGGFLLAADRKEAESLAESEDMLRDDGFPGEFLDHYMLETHFDVSGFSGAYWAADDAEVDADALVATAEEAARAAGVVFQPARVRGIDVGRSDALVETEDGPIRAPWVVVATDAAASDLLPELRPRLGPADSYRRRFVPEAGASLPSTARTADGRLAWQARPAGVTLAATGPPSAGEPEDADRLDALAARLHATPGSERRWTESAEISPDGLPIVGTVPGRPIGVACGFGPFAASCAFAAARWVAEAIVSGRDPTPGPFRVGRDPVVEPPV